ncbi:hypothetical protein Purlil1_12975 [Purpureocillium lilacinum]|uniref:Uncharacterized protein n=1 Tax=Purpureocillium lilacinum TaxID=33203 RepID=A0ABR0BFD4_PURLI|nr:hypothetical protein Purlil1_12975 [Purpureocillium lilacinum]
MPEKREAPTEAPGDEHLDTAGSMNDIVLESPERCGDAGAMPCKTPKTGQRAASDEHSDTLDSMMALASVLGGQKRHEESKAMCQAINDRQQVLCGTHPDTATN